MVRLSYPSFALLICRLAITDHGLLVFASSYVRIRMVSFTLLSSIICSYGIVPFNFRRPQSVLPLSQRAACAVLR